MSFLLQFSSTNMKNVKGYSQKSLIFSVVFGALTFWIFGNGITATFNTDNKMKKWLSLSTFGFYDKENFCLDYDDYEYEEDKDK